MAGSQFCYWVKDTVLNVKQIECAKPNINLGKRCLIRNGSLSTRLLSGIRQWWFDHMLKSQEAIMHVCFLNALNRATQKSFRSRPLKLLIILPRQKLNILHKGEERQSTCKGIVNVKFILWVRIAHQRLGSLITRLPIRQRGEEMIVLIDDAERLVNRWESGGSHSYACAPPPLPHTRVHPNTHSRQCF